MGPWPAQNNEDTLGIIERGRRKKKKKEIEHGKEKDARYKDADEKEASRRGLGKCC
jgi:hypothetical protein